MLSPRHVGDFPPPPRQPPLIWLRPSHLAQRSLWLLLGLLIAFSLLSLRGLTLPPLLLPALALVTLLLVSAGVAFAQLGVFARPLLAFTPTQPVLALTFDDGPHPQETPAILKLLAAEGHTATFFVIGEKAAQHPQILQEIHQAGHTLGHHSLRHVPWTPVLTAAQFEREVQETSRIFQRAGVKPPLWLRAPMGLITPPIELAARRLGLELVHWTATARDGVQRAQPERSLARLQAHLRPGAILVLHDGVPGPQNSAGPQSSVARQILPQLLEKMRVQGLRSVGLDVLLAGENGAAESKSAG